MAANRPGDWHVLDLEKDPTPGDPLRVKALSRELQDFADDVSDALRLVKGMASEDAVLTWAGKSAKVFQEEFEDVPKSLKKLEKSYGMAGEFFGGVLAEAGAGAGVGGQGAGQRA